MLIVKIFLLVGTIVSSVTSKKDVIVSTKSGLVKGSLGDRTHVQGKQPYWFRGIPFAEPPVGDLRFEPPVAKKPWKGILDVSQKQAECLQGSDTVDGDEDCLYLKVYTTSVTNTAKKLPVMVWVYGGAFFDGSPDFDDHCIDFLLDEDIVMVSFHYRVGIMGFFSTGDLAAPGNNGIRDQILALKWIKENIAYFGGDPNRITIFGQSAGAASISYLLQTNETKGLFSQAIMQSGSSLSSWALTREMPEFVKSVAKTLKLKYDNSYDLVAQLKHIDPHLLQTTSMSEMRSMLIRNNPLRGLVFAPVIEPDHKDAIITGKSHELLSEGKFHQIPLIVGYTSLEGMFNALPALLRAWILKFDAAPSNLVPSNMGAISLSRQAIGRSVKSRYFSIWPIATAGSRLMRFISDDQFERPIQETTRLYSSKTPVYMYQFSYEGALYGVQNRSTSGVGHTEDLGYIFDLGHSGTQQDYQTRLRMVKLWTNFVKYGNPTPTKDPLLQNIQWPANHGETGHLKCLDVNKDLKIVDSPNKSNMEFWKSLYTKYGKPPFDTY